MFSSYLDTTQRVDQKRKRKVAKQIISFDEDNSSSFSSSSVPSTSGSITSDINASQHSSTNNDTQILENSNQFRNFDSSRGEENGGNFMAENRNHRQQSPLIPMEETLGIGELTPVDNANKNDTSSISDESVEISTDISAVLTVVEMKNKEEQDRLQEKIDLLAKENDHLKLQLKEYVSALQIINRKNNEDDLEGKTGDANENAVSNETKLYEKKLVQVNFKNFCFFVICVFKLRIFSLKVRVLRK